MTRGNIRLDYNSYFACIYVFVKQEENPLCHLDNSPRVKPQTISIITIGLNLGIVLLSYSVGMRKPTCQNRHLVFPELHF